MEMEISGPLIAGEDAPGLKPLSPAAASHPT